MTRQMSNARILTHDERSEIEKNVTADIGGFLADVGLTTNENVKEGTMAYNWDPEKGILVAERYSENGNAIEFYEVRLVVGHVGNSFYGSEQ